MINIRTLAILKALCFLFLCGAGGSYAAKAQTAALQKTAKEDITAARGGHAGAELPPNIIVASGLRPIVRRMLERSPIFQRQCARLGGLGRLQIVVELAARLPRASCRAFATVTRYSNGAVQIRVQVLVLSSYVEVIGHEFEHALEQAEGLDLKGLAETKGSGVYQRYDGSFETGRAVRAGRAIASEYASFSGAQSPGSLANR